MIIIDGSYGEGGGQIFRSSLTLSMCLGQPVRIINIRAGRKKPGLLRQHLTCLKAAQKICAARVSGDALASSEVTFIPGDIRAGEYHFSVGSAGSTTLVFQTIFPALATQNVTSEVVFEGGTHNGMAPSFDYLKLCFLPAVSSLGLRADVEIERYGFYPTGGGRWRATIFPRQVGRALALVERGEIRRKTAVVTQSRISEHVARRELAFLAEKLSFDDDQLKTNMVKSPGPGNILSLRLEMQHVVEVFESIGERGLSAEKVAAHAAGQLKKYLVQSAPVGEYLADQLILPMVLGAGGCFRACVHSRHLATNIEVVKKFSGAEISVEDEGNCSWKISVAKP